MASIVRLGQSTHLRRIITFHPQNQLRAISTSGKKRETATITEEERVEECKTETTAVKKNWVSYGFDFKDEAGDLNAMHQTFFFSVTLCLVFGGFLWAYLPDYGMRDWAQREGYLELRRRENAGSLPIDGNLVDPSKIVLPSEEDLGDTVIII